MQYMYRQIKVRNKITKYVSIKTRIINQRLTLRIHEYVLNMTLIGNALLICSQKGE